MIYGPPVAKTSDLYNDTELTVPVLIIAQCAPQPPEEQFHPATFRATLPHASGGEQDNLIAVGFLF